MLVAGKVAHGGRSEYPKWVPCRIADPLVPVARVGVADIGDATALSGSSAMGYGDYKILVVLPTKECMHEYLHGTRSSLVAKEGLRGAWRRPTTKTEVMMGRLARGAH